MVYSVSYKERKRECSGYSNVVSGTGDIVKEDSQEASFKGNFLYATLQCRVTGNRITP